MNNENGTQLLTQRKKDKFFNDSSTSVGQKRFSILLDRHH